MRLLVLSSILPSNAHFRAGQTVLASLIAEFAASTSCSAVGLALATEGETIDLTNYLKSAPYGPEYLPLEPFATRSLAQYTGLVRKFHQLEMALSRNLTVDFPRFKDRDAAIAAIEAFRPDAILLFWDTIFEHLLADLTKRGIPCYGYLARPPQAAGFSRVARHPSLLMRMFISWQLRSKETRHLKRVTELKRATNICALDATWYSDNGVTSDYLTNTWPDHYGSEWFNIRKKAEARRSGIHVLANIGGLNATGNLFGLTYFSNAVLPLIPIDKQAVTFNICGRFDLPADLKKSLSQPRVVIRGFIPDIEEEMAGNHIFLLLNNAGPYTGGYTRVVFAFASGGCLIAHTKLKESMPELEGGVNCLLGDTPQEIASLILRAANDSALREKIGSAARKTYDSRQTPARVSRLLLDMVGT